MISPASSSVDAQTAHGQIRAVWSAPVVTTVRPSGLNAALHTAPW